MNKGAERVVQIAGKPMADCNCTAAQTLGLLLQALLEAGPGMVVCGHIPSHGVLLTAEYINEGEGSDG